MNYSWFGAICELESARAVAPQKPWGGATVYVKRKSICVHFDVRKSALNVLLYMKATHLRVHTLRIDKYLNNVLSCCTHNVWRK